MGFPARLVSCSYYLLSIISLCEGDTFLRLTAHNFRIVIFDEGYLGQGLGSWAVEKTRDFAFEQVSLHRLELEVFSFNPRAKRAYEKAGFRLEGIKRDSQKTADGYADTLIMSILEDEWKTLKKPAD
ncbi:GNAT family N-acetyltransferase [Streptococcus sp. ZY1909104]|uniref:GNAT family N-acetyltransferase n=1 Tax=Streptococcus sp. ZY1909104 TaxID=3233335 RepID=UPI00349F0901